ncbi:DUF945 family protein [Acinetobacter sp. YH12135]|uniref:DUF945 family protein n=1 Tax=Acinetobacter sp. YH12135 TaxID=2601119 RepID=UPI0015D26E94|nr:DUF945 family protein [Acinetobacter sp. YH12135]
MSKIVWGGMGVAVLAGAVTAGNLYADKSLREHYQQNLSPVPNVSVQYTDYDMGTLTGTAKWKMTIIADPCNAKEKLVFHGQDQIQRTWKGYQIDSKMNLEQGQGQFSEFFQQPLNVTTQVNWLGVSTTKLSIPAIEKKEAGLEAKFSPMQIEFQAKQSQGQQKIVNMSFDVPQLTVLDQFGHLQVKGMQFKTNQALNVQSLEPGYFQFSIAEMQRQDPKAVGSGKMKDFSWRMDTQLHERTVDIQSKFKIDELGLNNVPAMQDLQVNWDVKNLQRSKMQTFLDIVQKQNNSCLEAENFEKEVQQALLAVINEGFQFESKKNQLKLGTGSIRADLVGKVMPGHQTTVEGLAKMFPSLLEVQTDVSFNKQVVKTIMNNYMNAAGKSMSDQELEQILSAMQSNQQIQRDGDEFKLSMHYQYGEKKFLTGQ